MCRQLSIVLAFCLVPLLAFPRKVSLRKLQTTGLPVVVVETEGHEEPTCEFLRIDSGYPGNTIRNATKVPGRVLVVQGLDTLYDSGPWLEDVSGMTVKMRGNSSAFRVKHPFKLKLQKKADMLTRGNDAKYKDKDWLLLDGSTLNMLTGMMVSRMMELQWTPAYKYVNLLFNGDYRGIYILCESVKRNPRCRLDVSEDQGFIITGGTPTSISRAGRRSASTPSSIPIPTTSPTLSSTTSKGASPTGNAPWPTAPTTVISTSPRLPPGSWPTTC